MPVVRRLVNLGLMLNAVAPCANQYPLFMFLAGVEFTCWLNTSGDLPRLKIGLPIPSTGNRRRSQTLLAGFERCRSCLTRCSPWRRLGGAAVVGMEAA